MTGPCRCSGKAADRRGRREIVLSCHSPSLRTRQEGVVDTAVAAADSFHSSPALVVAHNHEKVVEGDNLHSFAGVEVAHTGLSGLVDTDWLAERMGWNLGSAKTHSSRDVAAGGVDEGCQDGKLAADDRGLGCSSESAHIEAARGAVPHTESSA